VPLVEIRFERAGSARISPAGRTLFLNGNSVAGELEPLAGDVIEVLRDDTTVRWKVGA
jgi:hypothetical protein